MSRRAIFLKEYLKLKWPLTILFCLVVPILAWFWWSVDLAFHTTEPEAMLWYHAAQLGNKPYQKLIWFYLFSATLIAWCQAVPEMLRNRIRILIHLPLPLYRLVFQHLLAGAVMIITVNLVVGTGAGLIVAFHYPAPIATRAWSDLFFWLLPSLVWYVGWWAVIVETGLPKRLFNFLLMSALTFLALKSVYHVADIWILPATAVLAAAVYGGFLSIKSQGFTSYSYRFALVTLCCVVALLGIKRYQQEFVTTSDKYYIFYSPVLEDFVFQQNLGNHQYRYASATAEFTREGYEEVLPFVYWRNLEIQGKMPVAVGGSLYTSEMIRDHRLSVPYHPQDIESSVIPLYPLFNPSSIRGILPFPNQAFALAQKRLLVYNGEQHSRHPDPELTATINERLLEVGAQLPITNAWGRTTSMKPFDWGYFLQDNHGQIFHLRRADDHVTVKPVMVDASVGGEIVHMQMVENRQMEFYGFAITSSSEVLLVRYPDYDLIPLPLAGFDHTRMQFQLLSDPLHHLVRYDDGSSYRAAVFDRNWRLLKATAFK